MRVFFAVVPETEVVTRVAELRDVLRRRIGDDGVRWARTPDLHFTLAFLGEQDEARVQVAIAAARPVAAAHGSFRLEVRGLGAFPEGRDPRVLWIGAGAGAEPLRAVAEALAVALEGAGFPRDERGFHPHLTLARIQGRAAAHKAAKVLQQTPSDSMGSSTIARLVLMESRPGGRAADATAAQSTGGGAGRYVVLADLPLTGA